MKKKLSFLLLALVTVAAFAYKVTNRAVAELAVVSEATTWDFSTDVTSSLSTDLKYEGDDEKAEKIYANIAELTFAETFKADALAFTGQYPFRSNSKKFAQAGTLHFKTSVAGKIVVKFTDTGSGAAAKAVKRYLLVNGEQTKYWTSRENNGTDAPYAAQLNVTTDEIDVPAGDVTIAGSSAICVSLVKFTPNAAASTDDTLPLTLTFPTYNDKSVSNYTDEWTATVDGKVWTLNGFNNNKNGWSSVKCGRKGYAHTATITSPVINAEATNVVYTVSKTSNLESVMFTILNGDTEVSTTNITDKFVAGSVNVEVAGQKGYSYKLTVNSTEASANGTTEITKIAIYGNGQYVEKHIANTIDNPYTVAEAYELIDAGEALTETVFVKGIISQIDEKYFNAETGTIQYWISDDGTTTKQLEVYKGLGLDGAKFTSKDDIALGAKVIVTGKIKKYNTTYEFDEGNQLAKYTAPAVDIEISPESGDISAALATAIEGKNVGNITINLTKDVAYTISAPIVAPASLAINGNGATIDASAVSGPLFQHGATAVAAPRRAPVTPVEGYTYIDDVSIENVTITGIKGSIYWDGNQKTCIEDFTIDNAVLVLATESSSLKDNTIISFQGGCAKDFTVKKSTIYGNGVAKYFNKANNGADFVKAGYEEAKLTYENNTFYNVLNSDGQWGNNLRYNNNKAKVVAAINNNIWSDCGNGQIMRRLLNTNFKDLNAASTMANNIFNANGAVVDQANYGNGSDLAAIVTFPEVADAKFNAELGVAVVPETPIAVGDPRWTVTAKQVPFDIEISPAEGDIAAALATASAGKLVKDIKINLTKDVTYTISAPIVAPNSLVINGNGATIDASAVSGPLFQHGATAVAAPRRAPVTPVEGYTYIDDVSIENVTITGIKGSIYWDGNQKTCIEDFTIDNAVLVLATESSSLKDNTIISFQGGCAKDFTVKKSTIYGNGVAKYFNKANNGADFVKAGYEEAKLTYENNTFYNVLNSDGQWGNNLRYNNNKAKVVAAINNNIWSDCGNGQIMRRLLNTNFKDLNAASTMANNIFNANGAVVDQANYGNGSDLAGIVTFEDAAAGKFGGNVELPYGVEKPAAQPGDARWTLTYTNAPQKFTVNLAAVENGTVTTDATGALAEGTLVTITATPNEGYELGAITVTGVYSNLAVVVTDGKFTMPADDVTVTVTFKVSTGIQNVSVENNSLENATFYDLNGRRVENPTKKGIYIVNGKKVVIK